MNASEKVVGPALLKIVKTETSKTVASGLIKSDQFESVYMRPSSSLRSKVSAGDEREGRPRCGDERTKSDCQAHHLT